MIAMANYLDLLNSDGTRNILAFAEILARRIEAETNLRLCASISLRPPSDLGMGEVAAWRAEQVKLRGLGPVSADERKRIADHELREMDHWVRVAQQAAGKQRDAMNAAYALAAE